MQRQIKCATASPFRRNAPVCRSITTTSMVRSVPAFCSVEYTSRRSSDNPDLIFLSFILYSTSQHEHFGICQTQEKTPGDYFPFTNYYHRASGRGVLPGTALRTGG